MGAVIMLMMLLLLVTAGLLMGGMFSDVDNGTFVEKHNDMNVNHVDVDNDDNTKTI